MLDFRKAFHLRVSATLTLSAAAIFLAAVAVLAAPQTPNASTAPSPDRKIATTSDRKVATTSDRKVAITIDDLPYAVPGSDSAMGNLRDAQSTNRRILQALHKHNAPAIGFVIERKLQVNHERDARAKILQSWLDAGMDLGNHTFSHVHFNDVSLEQFEEETVRGGVVVPALMAPMNKSERYFRHPALLTGPTPEARAAFEAFLATHKLRVGPVSVENSDYAFNDVLDDAQQHHDNQLAATAKSEYLALTAKQFLYVEALSNALYAREIPQILLIHDNKLNAELLDGLLTALHDRGYRFVSLDDALSDPAYAPTDRSPKNLGLCYLCWEDRLKTAGIAPTALPEHPRAPDWVETKFQEIRKRTGN